MYRCKMMLRCSHGTHFHQMVRGVISNVKMMDGLQIFSSPCKKNGQIEKILDLRYPTFQLSSFFPFVFRLCVHNIWNRATAMSWHSECPYRTCKKSSSFLQVLCTLVLHLIITMTFLNYYECCYLGNKGNSPSLPSLLCLPFYPKTINISRG